MRKVDIEESYRSWDEYKECNVTPELHTAVKRTLSKTYGRPLLKKQRNMEESYKSWDEYKECNVTPELHIAVKRTLSKTYGRPLPKTNGKKSEYNPAL